MKHIIMKISKKSTTNNCDRMTSTGVVNLLAEEGYNLFKSRIQEVAP